MENEFVVTREIDMVMQELPARNVGSFKGYPNNSTANNNETSNVSSAGNNSTNSLQNTKSFECAVESPSSAAPSPLIANQTQPSVNNPNADPTMPTLSPQPLTKTDKVFGTNSAVAVNTYNAAEKHGHVTLKGNSSSLQDTGGSENKPPNGISNLPNKIEKTFQTLAGVSNSDLCKVEMINTWLESQKMKNNTESAVSKRPILQKQGYEVTDSEELKMASLYNFESLNTW